MRLLKTIILAFSFVAMVCVAGCGKSESLVKNYGWSHGTVNIEADGAHALTIDEIVPSKSELSENLEKAGFTITEYNTALGSNIAAERIYAEKDGMFIDICYVLSVDQAKETFTNYESTYKDYYLIAQNEVYVYAVSDENTFETAGFDTLETNGVLFIRE
jgi:hypothetical protein